MEQTNYINKSENTVSETPITENVEIVGCDTITKKARKPRTLKVKVEKPKKEKKILVRKTDDPTYYLNYSRDYYTNNKEVFQVYTQLAKEKLFHCVSCNRGGKAKNHQRHNRTTAHANKLKINLVEL